VLGRLAKVEAQLFQALLEDVFAGHGCVMLLEDDVACGIGEVNADVNCGDESEITTQRSDSKVLIVVPSAAHSI